MPVDNLLSFFFYEIQWHNIIGYGLIYTTHVKRLQLWIRREHLTLYVIQPTLDNISNLQTLEIKHRFYWLCYRIKTFTYDA